jgi:hypothetical protein
MAPETLALVDHRFVDVGVRVDAVAVRRIVTVEWCVAIVDEAAAMMEVAVVPSLMPAPVPTASGIGS